MAERRFFRAFDEDHVDDADNRTGFRIVERAATVAGIGGRVELKHAKRAALDALDHTLIQLAGRGTGLGDGGFLKYV